MKPFLALGATLLAIALVVPPSSGAEDGLQAFLEKTLAAAREKDHLPAVAAVIQIDGKLVAEAALGVRALGHPEKVTTNDRWDIGSDTKAFTATLIARLVEQGVMSFDDTLAASFPAFAKEMDPAYRNITVTQLLSHTAGLPPLTEDKDLPPFMAVIKSANGVKAQREAIARKYLTMPPATKAGEFVYSNLGFITAGAIAEAHTGKTWEELIREQVFAPLGIKNAGFGLPGTPGKFDQPWGHKEEAGKLVPLDPGNPEADNPPALGPAGTINIALKDWLLFAQDQLDGVHGRGKLLKPESYQKLHTPVTGNYALGWGAKLGPDGVPLILTHTGSNGFWVADIRIMPKHDMIFLVATNVGNEAANDAVKDVGTPLKERLKPLD
ncbi:MAG: serine hydrolase domain-containing protein [Spartobacteria bacterium]